MSRTDAQRLHRATQLATISECKQKHGAILVSGGRTISIGINTIRNHPRTCGIPDNEYSVHAEVAALRSVPEGVSLKNATMYVARVSKGGNPAMSAPCPRCQVALREAGVKKIVYTIDKEKQL